MPRLLPLLLLACTQPLPQDTGPGADLPRPEHPRPDWRRPHWSSLNGTWAFALDPEGAATEPPAFTDPITVPFTFEAPASGLGEPFPEDGSALYATTDPTYQGVSWYQRVFEAPGWADARTFAVFGAVDWRATVWLNGVEVGAHEGGWLPFEVELTEALRPGPNVLTVRVEDLAEDEPDTLIGKQGGAWYTRSSGIWQSVYLEGRPATYLTGAWFLPDWQTGEVALRLEGPAGGDLQVEITDPRGDTASWSGEYAASTSFDLPALFPQHDGPALWSPADPAMYEVTLRLGDDEVHTAFGVRGLGLDWAPGHGPHDGVPADEQFQVFTLNGAPLYLRGVLDQNYHPEGLLTYPDVEALAADLQAASDLGFNLLRVHMMHPEPLKLALADRLGLLVMADVPSPYTFLDNTADSPFREHWSQDFEAAWRRDANHPSLVSWVLFNEAWGLLEPDNLCEDAGMRAWVEDCLAEARALDPTRWIEDDSTTDVLSGVFDHLDPDFTSWHFYSDDWDAIDAHLDEVLAGSAIGGQRLYCDGYAHRGQPLFLSEVAGASCYQTVGLTGADIGEDFLGWVNAVRARPRIGGYVFTQLTDVEWERNGLLAYDRTPKPLGFAALEALAHANAADAVVISGHPGETLTAGEIREVTLSVARGGDGSPLEAEDLTLAWRWGPVGCVPVEEGSLEIHAGWGLTDAGTLPVTGLDREGVLLVQLRRGEDVLAATERRFPQ